MARCIVVSLPVLPGILTYLCLCGQGYWRLYACVASDIVVSMPVWPRVMSSLYFLGQGCCVCFEKRLFISAHVRRRYLYNFHETFNIVSLNLVCWLLSGPQSRRNTHHCECYYCKMDAMYAIFTDFEEKKTFWNLASLLHNGSMQRCFHFTKQVPQWK